MKIQEIREQRRDPTCESKGSRRKRRSREARVTGWLDALNVSGLTPELWLMGAGPTCREPHCVSAETS